MKQVCIILARTLQGLVGDVVAIALLIALMFIAALGLLLALLTLPAVWLFIEVDTWRTARLLKKLDRKIEEAKAKRAAQKPL